MVLWRYLLGSERKMLSVATWLNSVFFLMTKIVLLYDLCSLCNFVNYLYWVANIVVNQVIIFTWNDRHKIGEHDSETGNFAFPPVVELTILELFIAFRLVCIWINGFYTFQWHSKAIQVEYDWRWHPGHFLLYRVSSSNPQASLS